MSDRKTHRSALLGKRVASYRSLPPAPWLVGTWILLLALLTWELAADRLADRPRAAIALVTAVASLGLACWLQRPRVLELYQHGFTLRVGDRERHVLWHQVYEIYQTPHDALAVAWPAEPTSRGWLYCVVRRDGRQLRIHSFEAIRDLGMRMQLQVARRQLPIALDAFQAGHPVRFGRQFTISREGIRVRRRFIPWRQIAEISIDEASEICVIPIGSRPIGIRIASSRVPNLRVLDEILRVTQRALADELERERGGLSSLEPDRHFVSRDSISDPWFKEGLDGDDQADWRSGSPSRDERLFDEAHHRPRRPR